MKKNRQTTGVIAYKLRLLLIKRINYKFDNVKKKKQKKEIIEEEEVKIIAAKRYRTKEKKSLSNIKKKINESNIKNNIDLYKINNKYILQVKKNR